MLPREKGEVEWRAGESGWDEGKGSHAFGYQHPTSILNVSTCPQLISSSPQVLFYGPGTCPLNPVLLL